jgi:hypothetical protein
VKGALVVAIPLADAVHGLVMLDADSVLEYADGPASAFRVVRRALVSARGKQPLVSMEGPAARAIS